jgi:hypothetical protein
MESSESGNHSPPLRSMVDLSEQSGRRAETLLVPAISASKGQVLCVRPAPGSREMKVDRREPSVIAQLYQASLPDGSPHDLCGHFPVYTVEADKKP